MSGSPPLPPRRNPEFDDRGQGGLGAPTQDVSRGWQTSQTELREPYRGAPVGPSYQQPQAAQYPSYQRVGDIPVDPSQYQYQQQQPLPPPPPPQQQQQQHPPPQAMATLPMYSLRHPPPPSRFPDPERYAIGEEQGYSPKTQRKTKGHVASACVPCKRAHLRCDSQRPCSRCISNGKEEACVDVQHKKRGRPRLRDEREPRFEGLGQAFGPQPDHLLRRPMPLYSSSDPPMHQGDSHPRSGPYRVLKSQSGGPSMMPRYLEHASPSDANVFASHLPPDPRGIGAQDVPFAFLNMELQISTASRSLCDTLGVPSLGGRKLLDIVAASDRDKVYRLQRSFEDERQEREPNYLPPIYGKAEEDRVIQSIGLNLDAAMSSRNERHELLMFQEPSGQQRSYPVRLSLSKKESTYFVVLILSIPSTPQDIYQMSSSPYHGRDAGFAYRTPQQSYQTPVQISLYPQYPSPYNEPRMPDPQTTFRQPPPLMSNSSSVSGPTPSLPSYAQPFTRIEYGQTQPPRQIPRSEAPQGQVQRQSEFRLPPIQSQPGLVPPTTRGDDRGRVDIGGLLEKPEPPQRKP